MQHLQNELLYLFPQQKMQKIHRLNHQNCIAMVLRFKNLNLKGRLYTKLLTYFFNLFDLI